MNNIYSAMRKLFREVLNAEWNFKKLPRSKKEKVDSDRKQIRIQSGKGRKDRYVQIPELLIPILRGYYKGAPVMIIFGED